MITNKDFLQSVFNNPDESSFCWITAFPGDPRSKTANWSGTKIHATQCPDFTDKNSYFSTALFDKESKGRSKEEAKGVWCIVLDDLGDSSLRPTWKLETSANNYQIGFALSEPINDIEIATRLMKEIANKAILNGNDTAGNNPVRNVRLPVGINNKNGSVFQHNLVEWNDALKYSLNQIITGLGLDASYILNAKSQHSSRDFDEPLDIADLVRQLSQSEHYYEPLLKLTASLVAKGTPRDSAIKISQGIMQAIEKKPSDWHQYYKQIPSMVDGAVAKFSVKSINADDHKYGDIYNGKVFSKMFRGSMLFCHSNKTWLRWNGDFWVWCHSKDEDILAKEAAKKVSEIYAEAFIVNPQAPELKSAALNAKQIRNNNKRNDMLQAASTEPGMFIKSIAELDADKMLLGCQNGVLDLRTGTLLDPDPKMLMTKSVNVSFDRLAECPKWLNFLDETFSGNEGTIKYLQKALGYSITGNVSEEVVHFCSGFGRNGKTLMTNVIYELLGDYSIVINTDVLMRSDQHSASSPSPEIVSLQGRRFVVANEIEDGRRLNDKHLKILASNQAITARDMYSKPIDFMPQHKIWVTTNHRPIVTDQTDGAWRRLRILPFKNQVPQEKIDYHLESKLLVERAGILNWLVEGCLLWLKERLRPCKEILEASENYRMENDTIGAFIDECCVLGSGLTVTKNSLHRAYKTWCQETSQFAFGPNNLSKKLEVHGVTSYRTNSVRGYVGISLNYDFAVAPE